MENTLSPMHKTLKIKKEMPQYKNIQKCYYASHKRYKKIMNIWEV